MLSVVEWGEIELAIRYNGHDDNTLTIFVVNLLSHLHCQTSNLLVGLNRHITYPTPQLLTPTCLSHPSCLTPPLPPRLWLLMLHSRYLPH